MIRLVHRLHDTHDAPRRKHMLLAGVCEIVNGSAGSCVVAHHDDDARRPIIASNIEYRRAAGPEPGKAAAASHRAAVADHSACEPQRTVDSVLHFPNSTMSATLKLHREPADGARFTARDRALLNFLHAEVMWIYQVDVLLTSPNARALAPRARETLEHLLAGLSEKQIASKLRLSPNTVHHYVKSIHRHFGVSSRSELLARWVGK